MFRRLNMGAGQAGRAVASRFRFAPGHSPVRRNARAGRLSGDSISIPARSRAGVAEETAGSGGGEVPAGARGGAGARPLSRGTAGGGRSNRGGGARVAAGLGERSRRVARVPSACPGGGRAAWIATLGMRADGGGPGVGNAAGATALPAAGAPEGAAAGGVESGARPGNGGDRGRVVHGAVGEHGRARPIMKCMTPDTLVETALPPVPLTVEGASVLHQMMKFRWPAWRALSEGARTEIAAEAAGALGSLNNTAVYSLLGHKGDLMLIHFRKDFEELNRVELELARLRLSEYLETTHSYLSIVELGLYESTSKVYGGLAAKGVQPHSDEWKREIEDVLERQRQAMAPRLWPDIPGSKYLCFYPMDRKRGEQINWYMEPMAERQRMMHEHGMIGRRYAGEVRQIISGSIGFDDWEWGVDLFADDPLVFKKLIYEMRFDEVSAVYALFGTFYVGMRLPVSRLPDFMTGKLKPVRLSQ